MRELNVAPIQYLEDLEDLDNMYESYIVAPLQCPTLPHHLPLVLRLLLPLHLARFHLLRTAHLQPLQRLLSSLAVIHLTPTVSVAYMPPIPAPATSLIHPS